MSACQQATPEPKPQVVSPPKIQSVALKPTISDEDKLIMANYMQEDAYSKVFKNCFETGKIGISHTCKIAVNKFLKNIQLSKKRNIIIEVHTDKEGTSARNLLISKKRAYHVASSLYYKEYKYSKVYYHGFGEEKLLYDANTSKANSENRRLIVKVRDKSTKIDKKLYTLYIKRKAKATKIKINAPLEKEVVVEEKVQTVNLKKYTGKADVGWIYFGKEVLKEKFTISCAEDKPRRVKHKSMKGHTKEEFVSAIYKKTFKAKVGKQTLLIGPISVFDNGYLPKESPNIVLTNSDKSQTVLTTIINSYNGEKGMLYRVFVNKKNSAKSKMECMDLVLSLKTGELEYGVAYFKQNNHLFSRELK